MRARSARTLARRSSPSPIARTVFQSEIPHTGVTVRMGRVLDGMAPHMETYGERGFIRSDAPEADEDEVVAALKESGRRGAGQLSSRRLGGGDPLLHGVRAQGRASRWSIACRCSSPSDPEWEKRFRDKNLPIVGDDIKAQLGATIVHRVLSSLFRARGVQMTRTYQLNTGGNTDFMNMLDRGRLASKKESKTEAVQSALVERLERRRHPYRPFGLHPLAQRQQALLPARRGQSVRRGADEPGAAPLGRGQPELGGGGGRCDPLLQGGAGPRHRRRPHRPLAPSSASTRRSSSATTSPPS